MSLRIAVYFTPPEGDPLTRAAAAWLGRDAYSGAAVAQAPVAGFAAGEIRDLTADPRRYGFHATLKPPFRLAPGADPAAVADAAEAFAAGRAAVGIAALRLERIGSFFALTPDGPADDVMALAADIVRAFDCFRAPPTPEEIERRHPERLPPRQRENLARWGYPYVFEDFRFHMTLTGAVPRERQDAVEAVLAERFAPFLGRPLAIDAVSLFVERDPPADFVVETRAPFGDAAKPMDPV